MSETRTRRGRPKGSGIDDRQRLDAIARLIGANPALKPTTAIRSLGVSDPSVIRRLRDKFNAVRADLVHDLETAAAAPTPMATQKRGSTARSRPTREKLPAGANCAHAPKGSRAESRTPRPRSIAAAAQTSSTRIAAVGSAAALPGSALPPSIRPAARAASAPSSQRAHDNDDDSDNHPAQPAMPAEAIEMLMKIFSAGVAATNTLMAANTTMTNQFLRSPYMSLALRQQLAFSEWAVGFVPVFQNSNKTAT